MDRRSSGSGMRSLLGVSVRCELYWILLVALCLCFGLLGLETFIYGWAASFYLPEQH